MIETRDIFVWLQTTVRRSSERTINSIERSDIGNRFLVITDKKIRKFPDDYVDLQRFWDLAWRDAVDAARIRRCSYILRLEDDILVNRHILHNVCRWRAVNSSKFGLGTLFQPDYWLRRPELFERDQETGLTFRNTKDVEGAQAQLIRTDLVEELLEGVPKARVEKGLWQAHQQPSFDWSLSRAAWALGLRVFVHEPALVNLHEGSQSSTIDLTQHRTQVPHPECEHYWGHKSFKPDWRAA